MCVLAIALTGCDTIVDVSNLPARVTGVGPLEPALEVDVAGQVVPSQLRISYTLRDYEGDDARIWVRVCEVDADGVASACGVAVEGNFSDGTARVPTAPFDTDVVHQFRWEVGCGLIFEGDRIPAVYDTDYVVQIAIANSDEPPVESAPFQLVNYGFDPDVELSCVP